MGRGPVFTFCICGHRDDLHQTLTGQVLADGQKPCYGNGDCSCVQWNPTVRTRHPGVFSRLPFQSAVDALHREGTWFEWVE